MRVGEETKSNEPDMKRDGDCRLVPRHIYLPDFDLDEHGNYGFKARFHPEANIKLYAVMFDQVRLQSSAFAKIPALARLLVRDPGFFTGEGFDAPLVSLGLERDIECYADYQERRLSVLTSNATDRNAEFKAYKENDAIFKARLLDQFVSERQIERPGGSVEAVFRRELLDENARFRWDESESAFARYVSDYCTKSEFFQTFDLKGRLLDRGASNERVACFSEMMRKCYFRANARVFGGLADDWHGSQIPLKNYVEIILGLTRERLERLGSAQLYLLKVQPPFRLLREVYFSVSGTATLTRICSWVYCGFPRRLGLDMGVASGGIVSAPLFRHAVEFNRRFISKGLIA